MANPIECILTLNDGVKMYLKKEIPKDKKAVVIIVHGLCEHSGRYDYLNRRLYDKGFGVYRFDNRGHGKSGGERGDIEDFQKFIDDTDEIVDLVKSENPNTPVFMFGHSMGGFITAAYGVKYKNRLKGQIFSGAAVTLLPIFEQLKENRAYIANPYVKSKNELSSLICRDETVVNEYDNDPLVLKETNIRLLGQVFVEGISWLEDNIKEYNYPCLILHGEEDKIVLSKSSKWLFKSVNSKDKYLKIYENSYHEILNEKEEKEEVIDDIINWMEERI